MKSIFDEYISKKWGLLELREELKRLIIEYNKLTNRYLYVYAADINKGGRGLDVSLVQDDFYTIQDSLRQLDEKKIDFYIETPGGRGEAAEEIAKFLRNKFEEVNFVIAGEAKSAGTILVLSGDNIYMTETGSLGPIDAQVKIGRSVVSAHDYKAWVDEKKAEAAQTGKLNPFDAIMVAQISPGELYGVINSLEFAKDLVKEWLEKNKFKNWTITRTQGQAVTEEMRKNRACEVAEMLCDHTTWRTHGRSLKIEDLSEVLLIEKIDGTNVEEVVYRIKTIIRLIFDGSTTFKIYQSANSHIYKTSNPAMPAGLPFGQANTTQGTLPFGVGVDVDIKCPKCNKAHKIKGYLDFNSQQIKQKGLPTNSNVRDNDILECDNCKFAVDLKPLKNQIENQTKRKVSFK